MEWLKTGLILLLCLGLAGCKAEAAPLFEAQSSGDGTPETMIYVDIDGAVRNPGVYKLRNKSRLIHLIEMSGGLKEDADVEGLTLSAHLEDGVRYVIPSTLEKPPSSSDVIESEDEPEAPDGHEKTVPINTASKETLETLPGIGPATAQAIIDHREAHGDFETVEALMDVHNIGEKTFEDLEALITLQP